MNDKKWSLQDIINETILIEEMSEKFYSMCAHRFQGTEMQMLFLQLAQEEAAHQKYVESLTSKYKNIQIKEEVTFDKTNAVNFSNIDELLKTGNMKSVVAFALVMEKASAENYGVLLHQIKGEGKDLVEKLFEMETNHIKSLERALRELELDIKTDPEEFHAL
jgi:rubrerythrin